MNDKSERGKEWQQLLTIVLLVGLTLMLAPAPLAHAVTITVTTTADELNNNGQCSLREAIANANADNQSGSTDCAAGTGNDTITFDISRTITLGSELTITDAAALTIAGPAGGITVSGNNAVRVFLVNSTFSANPATGTGGGICNLGALAVTNCTFSDNSAANIGGGIHNIGTLTVTNGTFSGNSAPSGGGGIRNSSPGATTLRNSIVANSTAGGECEGTIVNGGNNVDSGTSCGWGSNNGSLSSTDPQLGSLADNGGPTLTFALSTDSPAIDAVTYNAPNGCPTTDQRSYVRPVDGDENGSALCDTGAFEFGSRPGLLYLPLVLKDSWIQH
jgi:CSLREA domain-containing protein